MYEGLPAADAQDISHSVYNQPLLGEQLEDLQPACRMSHMDTDAVMGHLGCPICWQPLDDVPYHVAYQGHLTNETCGFDNTNPVSAHLLDFPG